EHFKWGLDRFMSEAQTLARFKHPNIVRVFAVFPENNTAYMVMEYEQGKGMHELLKKKKSLSQNEINAIILPILDGLEQVHAAGFIHRDIKPPNLFIREDGSPVLLDFGSARQSLGEQTRTLTSLVSPGFAPFEQYVSKSDKQGPWTDIYGLGATMYRAVTGRSPAEAMDRSEALLHTSRDVFVSASEINPAGYSSDLLAAIDHALAFKPEDRPQTIAEWKREFCGDINQEVSATNNAADPVVTPVDSESETIALTAPTLPINQEIDTEKGEAVSPSFFKKLVTRLKITLKRLLKWGAIIFGILVLLSILDKASKKDEDISVREQGQEKVTDRPAATTADEKALIVEATDDATGEQGETQQIIERLLSGAREDLDALRLTTPFGNNAVEKYRTVLNIDPDNMKALNGLDRVVDKYLRLMNSALHDDDLTNAGNYLHKAMSINPNHPGIASAREKFDAAKQASVQQAHEDEIKAQDIISDQPEVDVSRNLVTDSDRRDMQVLRDRLKSNPKDKQARKQLKKMADRYQRTVQEAIEARDYDVAEAYVREILKIAPPKSKAYKELDELLVNIDKLRAEAGD
ncbi:MAG: serine/threonine-protein kinase, partial [Gammaproteobacteria bacterium]